MLKNPLQSLLSRLPLGSPNEQRQARAPQKQVANQKTAAQACAAREKKISAIHGGLRTWELNGEGIKGVT
jgi:hypothetical protein